MNQLDDSNEKQIWYFPWGSFCDIAESTLACRKKISKDGIPEIAKAMITVANILT